MKLEEIVGYLPYGLRGIAIDGFNENIIETVNGIMIFKHSESELHTNIDNITISKFKPIFRPLSDLIKPITVDGETFIPMWKLLKKYTPKKFRTIFTATKIGRFDKVSEFQEIGDSICVIYDAPQSGRWIFCYDSKMKSFRAISIYHYKEKHYYLKQYNLFQLLYKWHFDIHGLIERGEAIDMNTLEV